MQMHGVCEEKLRSRHVEDKTTKSELNKKCCKFVEHVCVIIHLHSRCINICLHGTPVGEWCNHHHKHHKIIYYTDPSSHFQRCTFRYRFHYAERAG